MTEPSGGLGESTDATRSSSGRGEVVAPISEEARLTLDRRVRSLHPWGHAILRINSHDAPIPFGLVDGTLVDESSLLKVTCKDGERHNQGTLKYA